MKNHYIYSRITLVCQLGLYTSVLLAVLAVGITTFYINPYEHNIHNFDHLNILTTGPKTEYQVILPFYIS